VRLTRLSCHRFRSNEVRMWLSVTAYNLGNLWPRPVRLERTRQLIVDEFAVAVGGRLVKHPGISGGCWPRAL